MARLAGLRRVRGDLHTIADETPKQLAAEHIKQVVTHLFGQEIHSSVRTGYEISFTRYFYKPQPLMSLEEIRADILAIENETVGLLAEILGTSEG